MLFRMCLSLFKLMRLTNHNHALLLICTFVLTLLSFDITHRAIGSIHQLYFLPIVHVVFPSFMKAIERKIGLMNINRVQMS